jgi:hypothetical protein
VFRFNGRRGIHIVRIFSAPTDGHPGGEVVSKQEFKAKHKTFNFDLKPGQTAMVSKKEYGEEVL